MTAATSGGSARAVPARRPVPQRVVPHAPVRTFLLRRGRVTAGQADALARLWPRWGVDVDGRPLDLGALFGRDAPRVLEVGPGMGEATAVSAALQPELDLLAVDVHTPGHGNLLRLAETAGLTNLRIADGDARVLLSAMLAPQTLDEVRVWFPDPWPKAKHAKRRLLTPAFVDLVASRLRPGGRLHVATDWPAYAEQVVAAVAGCPRLRLVPVRHGRPSTRFERQAQAAGRPVVDLLAVRDGALSPASGGARGSARSRT